MSTEVRPVVKATYYGILAVVLTVLIIFTLEVAVKVRSSILASHSAPFREFPKFEEIWKSYKDYRSLDINPFYTFFFPFDYEDQRKIDSAVCTIDKNGFRGQGPEFAKNRKLAFILGGSAAFGYFSSSDSTTISGYLNSIQDEYHFVNAGVPAWNSTQELFRLVNQVVSYYPDLVITYSGANDIALMIDFYDAGKDYPPGTPAQFGGLYDLVEEHYGNSSLNSAKPIYEKIVPELSKLLIRKYREISGSVSKPKDYGQLNTEPYIQKYIYNNSLMNQLVKSRKAQFINIFQPTIFLHSNIPEQAKIGPGKDLYREFLAEIKSSPLDYEFIDFSDIFDRHYEDIPFFAKRNLEYNSEDVNEETIFLDQVHLSDAGNRIIAYEIGRHLQLQLIPRVTSIGEKIGSGRSKMFGN